MASQATPVVIRLSTRMGYFSVEKPDVRWAAHSRWRMERVISGRCGRKCGAESSMYSLPDGRPGQCGQSAGKTGTAVGTTGRLLQGAFLFCRGRSGAGAGNGGESEVMLPAR